MCAVECLKHEDKVESGANKWRFKVIVLGGARVCHLRDYGPIPA